LRTVRNINNNNKNYQKIEKLAEQKANDILNNKKSNIIISRYSCFTSNKK
jgi:hypothetical protein